MKKKTPARGFAAGILSPWLGLEIRSTERGRTSLSVPSSGKLTLDKRLKSRHGFSSRSDALLRKVGNHCGMVDPVNYGAVAGRVLNVGAQIARRHADKQASVDALAIKACIDSVEIELAKLELMAARYRKEFSAMNVVGTHHGDTGRAARCFSIYGSVI